MGCETLRRAEKVEIMESQVLSMSGTIKDMKKKEKEAEQTIGDLKAEIKELSSKLTKKKENIDRLKSENEKLKKQLSSKNQKIEKVITEKTQELSRLEKAKKELEDSLSKELAEYQAKLEMTEKGLMITFLAEIFFDSGKAVIRKDAEAILMRVSQILNTTAGDSKIAIEGHTDDVPIKWSKWKSNWELSSARALSVLHFFSNKGLVDPKRLSAVAYGQYSPVYPNDSDAHRQQNRRVEIIILPVEKRKVKNEI